MHVQSIKGNLVMCLVDTQLPTKKISLVALAGRVLRLVFFPKNDWTNGSLIEVGHQACKENM